ncbi:MAG: hypothetical protein L0958_02770, partial [Candidatus Mariimomonas ferrooxydans]
MKLNNQLGISVRIDPDESIRPDCEQKDKALARFQHYDYTLQVLHQEQFLTHLHLPRWLHTTSTITH